MIKATRAALLAVSIWLITAGLGLLLWGLYGMVCCSPVDYPEAVSESQGYARFGWITQAEADRRIAEARQEYISWAWEQAKRPLAASALAVPLLTLLILRNTGKGANPRENYAATAPPRA